MLTTERALSPLQTRNTLSHTHDIHDNLTISYWRHLGLLEVREGEKLTSCLLLLTSVINLISSGEINIKIMMPKMRYLGKTADRREIKIKNQRSLLLTLRLPILFISQLRTLLLHWSGHWGTALKDWFWFAWYNSECWQLTDLKTGDNSRVRTVSDLANVLQMEKGKKCGVCNLGTTYRDINSSPRACFEWEKTQTTMSSI